MLKFIVKNMTVAIVAILTVVIYINVFQDNSLEPCRNNNAIHDNANIILQIYNFSDKEISCLLKGKRGDKLEFVVKPNSSHEIKNYIINKKLFLEKTGSIIIEKSLFPIRLTITGTHER